MGPNSNNNKQIELLSPCGNYDCFISALYAGADAVYLAGQQFGARASADNFDEETLLRALDIAHINGKKIYLTVNTLLKDDEIDVLTDYLRPFVDAGLDGVIVQDLGVLKVINDSFGNLPIHASTQMAVTDSEGVEFLKKYNVKRVVLARELSLSEIERIHRETGMQLECFAHGALCYSYSGKCLMSSFIGGRSGNRGRCAQPCRLKFNDENILSMKDLCTVKILPQMIKAGIYSYKIEGRMKSPEYVYGVTSIYKKYLYQALKCGEDIKVSKDDYEKLIKLYSRGNNTEGYYNKYNGADMITRDFAGYNSNELNEMPSIREMEKTLKGDVLVKAEFSVGKPAEIEMTFDEITVSCKSDNIIERARRSNASKEDICKHLSKMGDSPFKVSEVSVSFDEDVFLPVSLLNNLRRKCTAALIDALREKYVLDNFENRFEDCKKTQAEEAGSDIESLETEIDLLLGDIDTHDYCNVTNNRTSINDFDNNYINVNDNRSYEINVYVENFTSLRAVLRCENVQGIILPTSFDNLEEAVDLVRRNSKNLFLKLPYVSRKGISSVSGSVANAIKQYSPCGVYISNLEELQMLNMINYKGHRIGDIHLYAYNNSAVDLFKDAGVTITTVPVELNEKEIIKRNVSGEDLIVYGRLPMMLSANCVVNTLKGCQKKYKSDKYFYIRDRKDSDIPVKNNCNECINVIYNSVPLSLHNKKDFIEKVTPKYLRFIFTDESEDVIRNILNNFMNDNYDLNRSFTRGHFNRGIM